MEGVATDKLDELPMSNKGNCYMYKIIYIWNGQNMIATTVAKIIVEEVIRICDTHYYKLWSVRSISMKNKLF